MTAMMAYLSFWPARNLVSKRQLMNTSFNRWHLANAYGAFGSITRERYEIIVEGSADGVSWQEYEFKGKPGDPGRMPRQFAPYHLRLDWLMWFLALGAPGDSWFIPFLRRLLAADRATLKLLRIDPFDGEPPRQVRALVYHYRYSTRQEKKATGLWWIRRPVGVFVAPMKNTAARAE